MEERDIISKIESLKEIKPNQEWVCSARKEILGENEFSLSSFIFRPAFATAATLMIFGGVFAYSQLTMPVQPNKAEEIQMLATQVEIEKLSLALAELKEAKMALKKEFTESVAVRSEQDVTRIARDIAPSLVEIGEQEEIVMTSLAVMIEKKKKKEDESLPTKEVVSLLIEDLNERTLTEEEANKLDSVKELYNDKEYQKALSLVLEIGQSDN